MNLLPPTESEQLKLLAEVALRCLDLELGGQDRLPQERLPQERLPIDLNPQSTPRSLLPALAWELGVEAQGLNEAEKRALLSSALEIRYQEGSLHACRLALHAVFGQKAILRRWFEEGAYTPEPHHFDIVLGFDEDFPAESFLMQMEKINSLLRTTKKVSAHFQFYAETILPEATVQVHTTALFDWHLEKTPAHLSFTLHHSSFTQGAMIWDF